MSKNTKNEKLLTAVECDDLFTGFKNDRERLKYMSKAYKICVLIFLSIPTGVMLLLIKDE